jgi:hypothetical protein
MVRKREFARCVLPATILVWAMGGASAQIGPIEDAPPPPPCKEMQPRNIVAAWAMPLKAITSAHGEADATAHSLILGVPNELTLVSRDAAKLPHAPGGAEQPKQYMYVGVARFMVPADGTYRVVTDEGMRTDIFAGGRLVDASGFGRGVNCSGKHVDFPLKAGDAILQLVGAPYEKVRVLIIPVP